MSFSTDKQRKWFFANHHEYGDHEGRFGDDFRERLAQRKRLAESVDNLNKLLGTSVTIPGISWPLPAERDNLHAAQNMNNWAGFGQPTDFGGAFMPRLPTTEELSRWPQEMAQKFFRCLDTLLQNNPLIIDPNALERHHGLPKAFVDYFLDSGLKIKDFLIIMRAADHRLKPNGVHTGKGRGGDWNTEWNEFINDNPARNTEKHQRKVEEKLEQMKRKYGIE